MTDVSTPANLPISTSPLRWRWPVLLFVHAAALAWMLHAGTWRFPDSDRYLTAARHLLAEGVLYTEAVVPAGARATTPDDVPVGFSLRPPGYPALLAALGARVPLVLLLQTALSLLNLWLVARWLHRHAPPTPARRHLFTGLALTAPGLFIYAGALMSEVLLQTLVVGLWLTLTDVLTTRFGRLHSWALASALAALALLTKPVFYPFAGVFLLLGLGGAWAQRRQPRHRAGLILLLACGPLLTALGWQARNAARTGYFHFSAIGPINLLYYNTTAVLRATEGPAAADSAVARIAQTAARQPTYAAAQQTLTAGATAALIRHPLAYAGLHARGMLNSLLDPGRFDLSGFLGRPTPEATGLLRQFDAHGYRGVLRALTAQPLGLLAVLALVFGANLLRLLLFGRFLRNRALPGAARLVAAGLVLYVIGLTGPLGAARFLVPVLPLLLLGAAPAGRPIFAPSPIRPS